MRRAQLIMLINMIILTINDIIYMDLLDHTARFLIPSAHSAPRSFRRENYSFYFVYFGHARAYVTIKRGNSNKRARDLFDPEIIKL